MTSKQFIVLTILVVLILGFTFYWFEYRQTMIRKRCYDISLIGMIQNREINYKNCLKDNGLEK